MFNTLKVEIPGQDLFDNEKLEFLKSDAIVLEFEHSLVSLSKWEARFNKPFLSQDTKTDEETYGYLEAMCLTPGVTPDIFKRIPKEEFIKINEYIEAKMTATWFKDNSNQRRSREIITSEIIYNWMLSMNVPLECEHWHLNRLFTLLRVVNEKNKPQKKMSKSEIASRNRELNAQRRAMHGTPG